jgi:hypothetical protein
MKGVIILLFVTLLASCTSLPTDYDPNPYPSDYEQIVKAFYDNTLHDPESAQYRRIMMPIIFWPDYKIGWDGSYLVCVTLNVKDIFGNYEGDQTDGLLIQNGTVVQYFPDGIRFRRQIC